MIASNKKGEFLNLLVGKRGNYNFSNLIIGKHRLKDSDKDSVPDIFDCQPYNKYKQDALQNTQIQNQLNELNRRIEEQTKQYEQTRKSMEQARGSESQSLANQANQIAQNLASIQKEYETLKSNQSKLSEGYSASDIIDYSSKVGLSEQERLSEREIQSAKKEEPIAPKPTTGAGYSYIDRKTGRGYEVSPTGEVKEIIPKEKPIFPTPQERFREILNQPTLPELPKLSYPTGTMITNKPIPPQGSEVSLSKIIEYPTTLLEDRPIKEEQLFNIAPTQGKLPYEQKGTSLFGYKYTGAVAEYGREQKQTETIQIAKYQTIADIKTRLIYDKYQNLIQKKIDSGELTSQAQLDNLIDDYSKSAEREANEQLDKLSKQYNLEATEREKSRIDKLIKEKAKEDFLSPKQIGRIGLYAVPYYGTTLFAVETAKQIEKEGIGKTGLGLVKTIPLAVGAGLIAGKAKGILKQSELAKSIEEGTILTKERGIVKESEFGELKLNEEQKLELNKLKGRDLTFRKYELKLKAKEGLESKTPKLTGTIIEASTKEGDIIERIAVGKLKGEYKGKQAEQVILSKGVSKIEESGIKGYTEVVSAKYKPETLFKSEQLKKPTISKYLEETKITGIKEKKPRTLLSTETTTSLISKEKYAGQKMEYGEFGFGSAIPDIESMKGKKIAKTEQKTLREARELEMNIYPEVYTKRLKSKELGIGITKKIAEEKNIPKKAKPYFTETPKVKTKILDEDFITLYSGTTKEAAKEILRTGLKKGSWATPELERAEGYAGRKIVKEGAKEKPAILEIDVRKSEMIGIDKAFGIKLKEIPKERIREHIKKEEPKPKYPTYVGGEGDLSEYAYVSGFPMKGGMKVKRAELAKAEAGGIAPISAFSFAQELPRELTRLNIFETSLGSLGKVKYARKEERIKPEIKPLSLAVSGELSGKLKPKVKEKEINKQAPVNILSVIPEETTTFKLKEQQAQKPVQMQQQVTRQRLKLQTRPISGFTGFTFPFEAQPEKFTFIFPEEEEPKQKKKKRYIAELRRRGKFIQVSKPVEFTQALGIGIEKAKTTLGASFRIREEAGKPIIFNLGMQEFRPSKREPEVQVQKRGFRLSNIFERREIQLARKGLKI